MNVRIKGTTVNLIAKLLHPLAEAGVLSIPKKESKVGPFRLDGRRSVRRYDTAIPTSSSSSLRKKTSLPQVERLNLKYK